MISFQNVSFTYAESGNGGVLDLNLIVRPGECVLLCGPSGCGKTTVTRLANGLIPHFFRGDLSGQVSVNGMDTRETEIAALSDAVGTVFQNPRTQFFNTDTDSEIVFGLENRGVPREALRSRLDELTEELHLSELRGRNIFELSGGEKQKIAFSSVYASAPDVLVFDEPSSNLDMKAIGELADLIQRAKISGKTILIAEHRIWYLMDIVDRVVYMQDGRIASDMEASAFKALPEADIRRMGLRVRDLSVFELGGVKTIAADGLLSVQKISVRLGGRSVLNNLSFQASRGEIIAIAGVNGAGKSTLIKLIMQEETPDSGYLYRGPTVRCAYLPQIISFTDESRTLVDTMLYDCRCQPQEARDRLGAFGFRGETVFTPVGALSGGEKSRLRLCMLMGSDINLLILDEPTNHLDIASREWIEDALSDYPEALLFVSHDRYFIEKFATRIWHLKDGKITDFKGTYSEYREYCERQAVFNQAAKAAAQKKAPAPKKSAPNRDKQRAKLEKEIYRLESELKRLDAEAEQHSSDYTELMRIESDKAQANDRLLELYAEWEELSE